MSTLCLNLFFRFRVFRGTSAVLFAACAVISAASAVDTPAVPRLNGAPFRPQDFGAKADGRSARGAAMAAASTTLICAGANFTPADAGKHIAVIGAGPDAEALNATIASVQSDKEVTLSIPAATAAKDAAIHWASDDRAALQETINAAAREDGAVVDFGSATYLIATAVPSPWHETTGLDVTTPARRKSIRFTGNGAKLVRRAITGNGHTAILTVRNNWDVVDFDGIEFRWEDLKDVSAKFEWWEGIRFTNLAADNVDMVRLSIANCTFWDCNRAWTIAGRFGTMKALRGKLKNVSVRNCQVLCPRGSNWRFKGGGSQGEYMGPWVNWAEVLDCTFDGAIGGDVSHTFAKKAKDGFLMGEPLNRVWRGGVCRHFDLEGAYCNVQNGIGRATFTMPAVGESVTIGKDQIGAAQVEVGEVVRIDQVGAFKVSAKEGDKVTLQNMGTYTMANGMAKVTNVAPGTAVKFNFIALDWITGDDCSVVVENVRFEGKVWDGKRYHTGHPCIRVDNMRSTIRNCTALDATVFTLNYQVPAERWLSAFWRTPSDLKLTWVTGNYVVLADADVVKRDWVTGIHSDFSRNVIIENNVIVSPVGKKFRGIDGNAGGSVLIRNNCILASGPADATSFGVTYNNHSGTIISSGNTFKNLGKNLLGDIIDRDAKR
jgi:hypothetical protein